MFKISVDSLKFGYGCGITNLSRILHRESRLGGSIAPDEIIGKRLPMFYFGTLGNKKFIAVLCLLKSRRD